MTRRPLPANARSGPYVFVCYAHEDASLVYPQIGWLQEQGFNVWWDEGISPGATWRTELAEAIQGCSLLLYFVTPRSVASDHCTREVSFALDEHRRPVLAVHLVETMLPGSLALSLSDKQAILQYAIDPRDYERKIVSSVATFVDQPVPDVLIRAPAPASRRSGWAVAVSGIVVGGLIAAMVTWSGLRSGPEEPHPVARFALELPSEVSISDIVASTLAISRDGRRVYFSGDSPSNSGIYVRELGSLKATRVPGSDGATGIFLSPDDASVVFKQNGLEALKKIPVAGGHAVIFADWPRAPILTWARDETILFSADGILMRTSESNWSPTSIVQPAQGEQLLQPHLLPEAGVLLYTVKRDGASSRIVALSLETGEKRELMEGSDPRVTSRGHLVFAKERSVWAAPFDPIRLEVTGKAAPVIDSVQLQGSLSSPVFAFAAQGSMVYLPPEVANDELEWVDHQGTRTSLSVTPAGFGQPRISPDGRYALVRIETPGQQQLWVYSFTRKSLSKLHDHVITSLWSADGATIIYARLDAFTGKSTLVRRSADATGAETILVDNARYQFPTSRSHDDDVVLYYECDSFTSNCDIGRVALSGDPAPQLLLNSKYSERHPALSPDGRWLAFDSNRSGAKEVYVRPYPDVQTARWQVSTAGGRHPIWSPDGKTLYYSAASPSGRQMMRVSISADPKFQAAIPTPVFEFSNTILDGIVRNYDLHPDGSRFLVSAVRERKPQRLIYVQNWLDEVERLVPTGS